VYRIREKQVLSDVTQLIVVDAPAVAKKAMAGQFVVLLIDEHGERIPMTIADYDRDAGTITLVFEDVGKSTMQLGTMKAGDCLLTVVGPLGHPTEIKNYGSVICIGGGVGVAPIFPIARALREAGNTVVSIIGARTGKLLLWEDRMRDVSSKLYVCTDDGSRGEKGLVIEPLKKLLDERVGEFARVIAIGPSRMMEKVSEVTMPYKVPTIVSLNSIMIDGIGMCGGCRVETADGSRFVCVDGPDFDAHKVNWEHLESRLKFYRELEWLSLERWKHRCALDGVVEEGSK